MIITILLVLSAVMLVVVLLRAARGQSKQIVAVQELEGQCTPVDIDAFRNLVDPDEEHFLRVNLPPREFNRIQRERMRAAVEYVLVTAQNAAVLLRLGEAARHNPDVRVAEAGRQMMERAIRLRIYAFIALLKLYAMIAFPGVNFSQLNVIDRYQRLTDTAARIIRLQHPGMATRISSAL
jgi:hypothetical protein